MRRRTALVAVVLALSGSGVAAAQSGTKQPSVGSAAIDAATQPLTDLGLREKQIPAVLRAAQLRPYDLTSVPDCNALSVEIARLESVLGPDADSPADGGSMINQGLKVGGGVLSGMIPFRKLVREFSGANSRRAEWRSAVYAGVARRSYLKGYGQGMHCMTAREQAVQSASEVLGLAKPSAPEPVATPQP